MKATGALLWVTGAHVNLRESQIKKLDDLVLVAIEIGRDSLSKFGRMLAEKRSGAAKMPSSGIGGSPAALPCTSAIPCKGPCVGCSAVASGFNARPAVRQGMQGPLRWLLACRNRSKNKPLVVSLDWTQVRSFDTLMVGGVATGTLQVPLGPQFIRIGTRCEEPAARVVEV